MHSDVFIFGMKKFFKVIGWTAATMVFLILIVVILITTPPVQNFLIGKITSAVSSKTHSTITIGRIGISFPKSVFVENIFLDDQHKDTLLYAGEIKADLDMLALLKGDIILNKISLEGIKANISRPANDSLYNFSFILQAFEGKDSNEKAEVKKDTSGFIIKAVELQNIHLLFDDKYAGIYAKADFEKLEIETQKLDIANLDFAINKIDFSNATASLTILKNDTLSKTKSATTRPAISVNDLDFKNIDLKFQNVEDSLYISLNSGQLQMKNGIFAGSKNHVSVDRLESTKTAVVFRTGKNVKSDDTLQSVSDPFTASLNKVLLAQTNFSYDAGTAKPKSNFDPDHIHVINLNLEASNSNYSETKSGSEIENFSFSLSEGFMLKKFKADALYTKQEIKLKNLIAETNNSRINADIECHYPSLDAFKNFPGKVSVDAVITNTSIDPQDIIWFEPKLASTPFLSEKSPPVLIKGNVNGTLDDLLVKNLAISSGQTTSINATGRITGLPEINKTFFAINSFQLHTTANDVYSNLPKGTIPENIMLPGQISVVGSFKGTIKTFDADLALNSSFGNVDAIVKSGPGEAYDATLTIDDFDAGKLLRDEKQFGSVTLEASIKGKGYSKETADAVVELVVSSAGFNNYEYQNLEVNGKFSGQRFEGNIRMDDPNLVFDFSGGAGFKKGEEDYKFSLNLEGANFQKLNFSKDDIRLAAHAELDLKGNTIDNLNGTAGITNIIIIKEYKSYALDSLLFASVNVNGNSEMKLTSSIVSASFKGNIAPGKLTSEMMHHFNRYLHLNDSIKTLASEKNNFTFEIKIQNHPVISEVFLPKLREFEPGIIEGKFDGTRNVLELKASLSRLDYDGTVLHDASLDLNSDSSKLSADLKMGELSSGEQKVENISLVGEAKNNTAAFSFTAGKEDTEKRLAFTADVHTPSVGIFETVLGNIVEFGGGKWNVPGDNKIVLARNKPPFINVSLIKENEQLTIMSKDSASLEMRFKDFEILSLTNLVKKDTAIAEGTLNGVFTLLANGAFTSQATLTGLKIRTHAVGDLELSATNSSAQQIKLDAQLRGNENNISARGTITPKVDENILDIVIDIGSVDMKTVDAFSFGQLVNSKGKISGELNCKGTFTKPVMNGKINFENVSTTPTFLSTELRLKNESMDISNSRFSFKSFTILDTRDHPAEINGTVSIEDLSDPVLNLEVKSDNFLAMNSANEKGQDYFGTVYLDSKIKLDGALSALKIKAKVKLDEGSNFGISIPESQLTSDRGENVVEFSNSNLNPVMKGDLKKDSRKSKFTNLDISADIEVDKNASLKIIIDQQTGDSLVVRGDAALSFTLDPGGKISLTGRYELDDGSYMVTLQDLIKKQFKIVKGSTLSWNGDPMDADIDMKAIYTVRTSPIDLISNQVSNLESAERNQYKQRLPFEVVLKLRGQLLKPDISFEIQLPPESRGAMGGVVSARLAQLNEDESELNKQVFALLVLNRFIQEDPLASENGNAAEGIARQTVSRYLSQQLNQWSAQHISGIELDFDVQSYDDYSTGQSQGRTELGIGLKKQFNDRLSVQVGGSLNIEGEGASQNNYGDLAGDILIEYKLTEDGRYKLKGFRQNQFEEIFEGQIMETGAGIVYTRDFDRWEELFRKNKEEKPGSNTTELEED